MTKLVQRLMKVLEQLLYKKHYYIKYSYTSLVLFKYLHESINTFKKFYCVFKYLHEKLYTSHKILYINEYIRVYASLYLY